MITENQTIEIRNYLLSKKLPLDLLIELEDHFSFQISHLELEENLSFDDAFESTKLTWREDLKMTTYVNGKSFSKMYSQIGEKRGNFVMLFTLVVSIVFCLSLFLLMNLLNFPIFKILFNYLLIASFVVPGLIFLLNLKDFLMIRNYKPLKLNIHQNHIIFLFIALIYIGSNYLMFSGSLEKFYNLGRLNTEGTTYATWILFFVASLFYFAGLFSQIEFLKVLKKTKPFLKNFQNYAD